MSLINNRERRRAKQRQIDRASRAFGEALVEIPRDQWRDEVPMLVRLFRNRSFAVYEFEVLPEHQGMVVARLVVQSLDTMGDAHLADGIPHSQLQAFKGAMGFQQCQAVEVFRRGVMLSAPPNAERELWVLRGLLPFDPR